MLLESLLAFFHISAVLGWIVFATSQAVMCRGDWISPAVVQRLVRLDLILWIATAAVLVSGVARIYLGVKGAAFYGVNPLLHLKVVLFAVVMIYQIGPSRHYRRWRARLAAGEALPPEPEMRAARRAVMMATHIVAIIPLPAVFLARGFGG